MQTITILPLHESQKIAAGEVVERPANVVKELIENSLDAQATTITLYLEDGGKQLIRIIDNGCGMSPEDAPLSIEPHATSKIRSVDELPKLTTFGFRGEALASIAAVSFLQLITRSIHAQEAVELTIEAGTITQIKPAPGNYGTDITIESLFYNVPARKKFLKSTATEWHAIQQLVQAYALDYPTIQFTLYHNNRLIVQCTPVQTMRMRAQQIFDEQINSHCIELAAEQDTIKLTGIMTDYQYSRYDRSQIYIFVNKRWIKNHKLGTALIKGYNQVLAGKFPAIAVAITVPTESIDINIHPRKEEVQFLHPRKIEQFLQSTVEQRLAELVKERLGPMVSAENIQYSPTSVKKLSANNIYTNNLKMVHGEWPATSFDTFSFAKAQENTQDERGVSNHPNQYKNTQTNLIPNTHAQQTITSENNIPQEQSYQLIGQLNKTYIVIETHEGCMLIDQHAAHERILYEMVKAKTKNPESIQLIFPQILNFTQEDAQLVLEQTALLQASGIEVEPFGPGKIRICATPAYIKADMLTAIFEELLINLHELNTSAHAQEQITHALHAMIACKSAVKAGDELTTAHMHELIKKLLAIEHRLTCPHGRPTSWLISITELERKFKRIA